MGHGRPGPGLALFKRALKRFLSLLTIIVLSCRAAPIDTGERVRTMTDSRDGQLYPTMGISGINFLAYNVGFKTPDSWCYNNNDSTCAKYGRLYSWEAAKKNACPAGWHLPSEDEWLKLVAGYFDVPTKQTVGDPRQNYTALTIGSFGAKLGGSRSPEGKFIDQAPLDGNGDGMYWTSTSCGADSAVLIVFNSHSKRVLRDCDTAKGWANSVRCARAVK